MKNLHRPSFHPDDPGASDTQSVRSGRSLASATSMTVKHPDLLGPGLNSSIIESVNASFEHGTLTKAVLVGEIALAYNHQDLSTPFGTDNIRLDNFSVLEKVAPNPSFVEQVNEKPGYYSINLSNITRTTVAFKYQVHHETTSAAAKHVPLALTSQWKVEPTQASTILSYGLHPDFVMPEGANSITLSNVAIVVHLDPSAAKPTSCKSSNGGVFARERSAAFWRLGEVTLIKDAPVQQLRARFFTDGEAKAGPAEARWDLNIEPGTGLGSGLDVAALANESAKEESDPFADDDVAQEKTSEDEGKWTVVQGAKKLRSGTTYTSI